MPPQTVKSGLAAKLGSKLVEAVKAHKDDNTEYGNAAELPEGINGGIAQLTDVKFGIFKPGTKQAGQYFFMAAGVVVSPKEHNGQHIEGLRTQIGPEPLCDTPDRSSRKSTADHVAWVLNEYRKLGVDTKSAPVTNPEALAAWLESVAATLVKQAPFFKFRTWKGQKQTAGQYANQEPRVNHDWGGTVNFTPGSEEPGGVEDGTGVAEPSANGDGQETGGEFDGMSLAEVAAQAELGNDAAVQHIEAAAAAAGIEQDKEGNWPGTTWADLVELIEGGGNNAEPPGEADPYTVGNTFKFTPIGKDGKPVRNPKTKRNLVVDVEIVAKSKDGSKVDIKNIDDGKTVYKGIKVEALQPNNPA